MSNSTAGLTMPRSAGMIDLVPSRHTTDYASYQPIVDRALEAFAQDPGYTEMMLVSARAIDRKRDVWQLRLKLRQIEKTAIVECAQYQFTCTAISPCGFGDCRFASDIVSPVAVVSTRGRQKRPQRSSRFPEYDREATVRAVVALAV